MAGFKPTLKEPVNKQSQNFEKTWDKATVSTEIGRAHV